jgi:hypothetical protein
MKLIINQQIADAISYLCKRIPNVEWMGYVLFSTNKKEVGDNNFEATIHKLLLTSIQDKTYVSYNVDSYSEAVLQRHYDSLTEEEYEVQSEWEVGLIHSHNTMSVFFSGEDDIELFRTAKMKNYYLSLIVNNANDYEAAIGICRESSVEVEFTHNYFNNVRNIFKPVKKKVVDTLKLKYPMTIVRNFVDVSYPEYDARIAECLEVRKQIVANKAAKSQQKSIPTSKYPSMSGKYANDQYNYIYSEDDYYYDEYDLRYTKKNIL